MDLFLIILQYLYHLQLVGDIEIQQIKRCFERTRKMGLCWNTKEHHCLQQLDENSCCTSTLRVRMLSNIILDHFPYSGCVHIWMGQKKQDEKKNRNDERGSEEFHGRKSVPFPQQCFWEILTFKNYNVEDSEIWSEDAFLSFHFSANFIGWNANPWPVNVNSVNLIPQPSRLSFLDGSTKSGF